MNLDLERLRARYMDAQLRGDRREALRIVMDEGVARGASVPDLQLRVVQDAQREIGRLWQENRISIADEHMATAISHLVLAHLFQHARSTAPNGRKVVVACVEGELHDLPARMVADALELAGFDVRFLGANVPFESLITTLQREQADLLALSVTMSFNVPALREAVTRVRSRFPSLPLAVGGGAFLWAGDLAQELGAEITASDAGELVAAANRILRLEEAR